jgi:hypothetical protein
VAARLHAEVDPVPAGRRITAMDVANLRYTRRVVSGVLRLHPVLLVRRTVVKPVRLGGIPRQPGAEVLLRPGSLHRNRQPHAETRRVRPGPLAARPVRPSATRGIRAVRLRRPQLVPVDGVHGGDERPTLAAVGDAGRVRPRVAVVERPIGW